MSPDITMETKVTLRQAFLVMHSYLRLHYELRDKPVLLGAMLGDLSLWDT